MLIAADRQSHVPRIRILAILKEVAWVPPGDDIVGLEEDLWHFENCNFFHFINELEMMCMCILMSKTVVTVSRIKITKECFENS